MAKPKDDSKVYLVVSLGGQTPDDGIIDIKPMTLAEIKKLKKSQAGWFFRSEYAIIDGEVIKPFNQDWNI